jgi:limonene-1,2-epoxide hydrolase
MNAEGIVRAELRAWSSLDADEIMRYFAPDAVWDDPSHGPISGYDDIRKAVTGGLSRMTHADPEILKLVATGGVVMTERLDHFTFDGKRIDVPAMGVFEVVAEKITAWRDYFDLTPHRRS